VSAVPARARSQHHFGKHTSSLPERAYQRIVSHQNRMNRQ
jgi:hypothetical protein